ncbi:MAG: hypothetical protein E6I84_13970 [Chloroflexi bacterium]|nr:MAG: hypothetical protein E6I84_13970 [Chloroflexota bacterium]
MPALLSKLAAEDVDKADRGWEEMYQQVLWHQGNIYSATAAAVPFITRIAALPKVHRRPRLVSFLAWCCLGTEPKSPPYTAAGIAIAVREATRDNLPLLRPWVDTDDRALGLAIAELAAALPFDLVAAAPTVRRLFGREENTQTRIALAGALAMLGDRSPMVMNLLLQTGVPEWAAADLPGVEDERFFRAARSVQSLFVDDAVYEAP